MGSDFAAGKATPQKMWLSITQRIARKVVLTLTGLGFYLLLCWHINGGPIQPLILLAVFVAATIASIAGFGFSVICAPMLLPLLDAPVTVVRTMVVCSLGIQALSVWHFRREIRPLRLVPFLMGSACSLPLGVGMLLHLDTASFGRAIGFLALFMGLWALLRPPTEARRAAGWSSRFAVGMAGGITGGVFASPSLMLTIWCDWQGWPKEDQRAVIGPYIFCMQLATLALMAAAHPAMASGTLLNSTTLYALVPALLGAKLGLNLFVRISDRRFSHVVQSMLALAGLGMIFR